jgi:predicted MFS family arabinose efflux permease
MSSSALGRPFRSLALSNLAAQAAEQLSLAAVPIVAVLSLQAGAAEVGLLAAAQSLPFLLLSLPLGVLADRVSRRRLMVAAEVLRTLALLGLLAGALWGRLPLAALAALGFLGAVGTVAFNVAAPALVSSLVPAPALPRANARIELTRSAAFAAGPATAGALVAWSGAGAAFVLAAVLSASAAVLLLRLAEPPAAASPTARHPLRELADGARFVWSDRLLRPVLLTALAWNLSWFVLQAAYVPYAMRALGLDARGVGLTLAAYGVGMVAGALVSARVVGALPIGRALQIGPLVSVLAMALMLATLAVPNALLASAALFLFGAGPLVWVVSTTTLRQTVTPPAMLGRVSALFLTVNAGARPVGALLGAAAGAAWGESACLWLALGGFALQAAIISPSRAVRMPRAVMT